MTELLHIALTGDTHADAERRFEDHNRIMRWIAVDARHRGCRAMLHSGDAFERAITTPAEREAVIDWSAEVAAHMPLIIVAGNHDNPLDIQLLGKLRTEHRILAAAEPCTLVEEDTEITIHCLPWPRRGYLGKLELESSAGINEVAGEALRNVLRGFSNHRWVDEAPAILLAHAMVRGSKASLSQPPLVGHDFELGVEDLALADADFIALGHIHMGQEWRAWGATTPDVPVIYPGSPRRCNYGEIEEKSYVIATFEGRRCVNVERVPTPAAPMIHLTAKWNATTGAVEMPEFPPELAGAEVRFRYDVPAEHRQAARAAAERVEASLKGTYGAASVKVEERVEAVARARAPEITSATTTWEKLTAHWRATRGVEDQLGGRKDALHDKLTELEAAL